MPRFPDLHLLASAAIVAVLAPASAPVTAATTEPVTEWATRTAIPLTIVDPAAPLDDFADLRPTIGHAEIVGLGESVHGASELLSLKHRTLRFLVEEMGFRSIAWEDDWTTGLAINEYILSGDGDLDAIVSGMSPQWPSAEVAGVLEWLREYNADHDDKVQFFGVEYYFTGQRAYDAVEAYIAEAAPARLDEVREHLRAIRPLTEDKFETVQAYMEVADKDPYIRHAEAIEDIVQSVPHPADDHEHQIAVHHARQIVSFHVHYDLAVDDAAVYREERAAENLRWWHEFSGDKVVYWAASPHTANAPALRIVQSAAQEFGFPSTGSYLRRWFDDAYLSIGFTFDHGAVSLGPEATAEMPAPSPEWFEQPLGAVGLDQFALDLRQPAPEAVTAWLRGPIITRGLADSGPEGYMTGGSLGQWFDVVVHRQQVSPSVAFSPSAANRSARQCRRRRHRAAGCGRPGGTRLRRGAAT